jgi:hypothetical protein
LLKLVSNWVWWQILFHSVADFGVLVSLGLNVLGIDVAKLLLYPGIGFVLPFVEGPPHETTKKKLLSQVL